jgi:tetratricopeptide (TPR) repeat protein
MLTHALLSGRPAVRAFGAARQPAAVRCRVGARQFAGRGRHLLARASSSAQEQAASAPTTAKEAVERGLEVFKSGNPEVALQLFLQAQQLQPDADEARAACYNAACAQARLKQWQAAVDSITRAVNDHDLKLTVALNDPDLAALRERREWLAALAVLRGEERAGWRAGERP